EAHRSMLEAHRSMLEAHRSMLEAHRSMFEAHRSMLEAHRACFEAHRSMFEAHRAWLNPLRPDFAPHQGARKVEQFPREARLDRAHRGKVVGRPGRDASRDEAESDDFRCATREGARLLGERHAELAP